MDTKFAPAERLPKEEVQRIAETLRAEILLPWFDAVPLSVLVINAYRQIVFCNQAFRKLSGRLDMEELIGLRPGEALRCVHAEIEPGGCGCSGFCRLCGAAQAILSGLRGRNDCQECRMLRIMDVGVSPLDLQVFTQSIEFSGAPFALFSAVDISHEKRLKYMERSFYHDLINVSGGISMLTSLMDQACGTQDNGMDLLAESAQRLVGQAIYHRDVAAAEAGRLVVAFEPVEITEFFQDMLRSFKAFYPDFISNVQTRTLCGLVKTDKRLLGHVLRNLMINAAEACALSSGTVVLSCVEEGGSARISVENPGEMGADIKKQLFKRYVSTKAEDRGLGCYVARLLTEKYLKGSLEFFSEGGRTVFTVVLPL